MRSHIRRQLKRSSSRSNRLLYPSYWPPSRFPILRPISIQPNSTSTMLSTSAFHIPPPTKLYNTTYLLSPSRYSTARINPRNSRPLGLRCTIPTCRGASAYRSRVVRSIFRTRSLLGNQAPCASALFPHTLTRTQSANRHACIHEKYPHFGPKESGSM